MFIEILKAIVIGIVQGITEWLPISSTGHMILVNQFLQMDVSPQFEEMFLVVIQLGSILAVLVLYFNKLNPFSGKKNKQEKQNTISLWMKVIVAAIPAGIIGILFDDQIDAFFYDNVYVIAAALIIYGILFIVIENYNEKKSFRVETVEDLSYGDALKMGLFQMLALIPGTSRSGSTIIGGMLSGISRVAAAEFSFFLAIPVMLGASFLKLLKYGFSYTTNEWLILMVAVVVAFVVSVLAIRFLMDYIKKHDFKIFGYYRIILGIIVIIYFLLVR